MYNCMLNLAQAQELTTFHFMVIFASLPSSRHLHAYDINSYLFLYFNQFPLRTAICKSILETLG